jgi:hypothetical protein
LLEIFGVKIPLMAPSSIPHWALFNLFLLIAAALSTIASALRFALAKGDRRRMALLAGGIVATVANAIIFLLTQDMRMPIVIFDPWSLLMLAIFIVGIVCLVLSARKSDEDKDELEAETEQGTAGR